MGKTLVLAEKPSVGRDIARILKCNQKGNGYMEGSNYIITWALGHLVTLAEPEAYSERYKTWKLEDLPMLPEKMDLVVIKQTAHQYKTVSKQLNRKDVDKIIIATDSGREGELVARWIIIKSGCKKPMKRLWISSQTDRAVREGFARLKNSQEYDNLYMSAHCRAEADWLVGLNTTRALTCKHNTQLSAGRVQTPTLAMVVNREDEIKKFVPRDFWTISATMEGFILDWKDHKTGNTRIFDKSRVDQLYSILNGKEAIIKSVNKTKRLEQPPMAYDLTELQRDANRRYEYSPKKTLNILQKLYEHHKLVTYPRTDSKYISDDLVSTLPERLRAISIGPYAKFAAQILKRGTKTTRRFVDNSKVTDHHAIIPTEQYVDLGSLNSEERHIYDIIVRRFLSVLSIPHEFEETTVTADIGNEVFTARGKTLIKEGWRDIYNDYNVSTEEEGEDSKSQILPPLKQDDNLKVKSLNIKKGKTKPPARYTEATLLSAMEHPEKFIENTSLKKVITQSSGLGTPATRADIIEKLFNSFYMEKRGKEIFPTSKGIQLIKLVPGDLISPELTAKWEQELSDISIGKTNPDKFIKDIRHYTKNLVSSIVSSDISYKHDNLVKVPCPECGKYLLEVRDKKGKMQVCQDRQCGYRKRISQTSNARCPECHKRMEIYGEGDSRIMVCSCGYREKFTAFLKRREDTPNKADKRDVQKFLKKQDTDTPINSALADALAKLKKD